MKTPCDYSPEKRSRGHGIFRVLMLASLLGGAAASTAADLETTNAGKLLFKDPQGGYTSAVHVKSEVSYAISGMVARVNLIQHFENQTADWQEAVYVFPLPETAAVNAMQIRVGDRVISASIKEKQQARQIFIKARSAGKTAALVEQLRSNLFTQSVANIAPGESIAVSIRFVQIADYLDGRFELRFPMTITPRYKPAASVAEGDADTETGSSGFLDSRDESVTSQMVAERADGGISIDIRLDAGMPVKRISSAYHVLDVETIKNVHRIRLSQGVVPMDRDFVLNWVPVLDAVPTAAIFKERVEAQDYVVMMILPPQVSTAAQPLPRDMVFVIDTSGSMKGGSIQQAKKSLQLAIRRLRPADQFNVIEFNFSPRRLFEESVLARDDNIELATRWVGSLEANGGTEMAAALTMALAPKALEGHAKHIVFITDGAVSNEHQLFAQIQSQLADSALFTVGIGSAPNSLFMRKAAQFGAGTFTHIGDVAEVGERMEVLFEKLDNPMATGISVQWPGSVEVYPQRIPALYLMEPLLVVARGTELSGDVEIRGETAMQSWHETLSLEGEFRHPGVGALWARAKIESLEDEKIAGGDPQQLRQEIIDVALAHELVSSHTSLVAVEEVVRRYEWDKLKSSAVPNLIAQGQDLTAVSYPRTATSGMVTLWTGLLTLGLALTVFFWREWRLRTWTRA